MFEPSNKTDDLSGTVKIRDAVKMHCSGMLKLLQLHFISLFLKGS